MSENQISKQIMLAIGARKGVRIFRNNTGMGWQGEKVAEWQDKGRTFITLRDPRPLHAGLVVGSSDLIGWQSVEITPEMVGQKVAVFLALEVKTGKGRTSAAQVDFLKAVQEFGGIAGIVRDESDAIRILKPESTMFAPRSEIIQQIEQANQSNQPNTEDQPNQPNIEDQPNTEELWL